MTQFLDLYKQYLEIREEVDEAIGETIRSSSFVGGKTVERFESEFARYQDVEHCVGVGNGTDALEIALEALALPADSEIIVPANTFIATSEAVTRSGHRVVFADTRPDTYTLDAQGVRDVLSARTRAVIAVHLYGQPCHLDEIVGLCREHGLHLIEDAAQAHGAEYKGRRVGSFGDLGTFSFYPGKNLGAYGDAGAIVTGDRALAERCRMIRDHGRTAKYDHQFEGRNSRLDGLQAAILSVKLRHLDRWTDRRRRIADKYIEGLRDVPRIVLPTVRPDVKHVFHLFVVRSSERDALRRHLDSVGVETGIHYPIALPKLQAYQHLGRAGDPLIANKQDKELLSLPIGEHLTEIEVQKVVQEVGNFVSARAAPRR